MARPRVAPQPRGMRLSRAANRTALAALASLAALAGACSSPATPEVSVVPAVSPTASATVAATPTSHLDEQRRFVGVNLDWTQDSVAAYAQRSGRTPDVLVRFLRFPLGDEDTRQLRELLDEAKRGDAVALVTLEPIAGLGAVTDEALARFAVAIRPAADSGVPVLVRFAHEMNGSWYTWGQQPSTYREAFARVARAVHQVPGAEMLWAPNYGGGYPFSGGPHEARPGTSDFAYLDTNGDGRLDGTDDPYAPYYPGDDSVDWVGMSLYHWGAAYPWGENEVPEAGKFVAQLTGGYLGDGGDDRAVPDFYEMYALRRAKPLAIPETGALFQPGLAGDAEATIKLAWFEQVFAPELTTRLPQLRMINWFEWRKPESEIGGSIIDWGATGDPSTASAFREASARWLDAP